MFLLNEEEILQEFSLFKKQEESEIYKKEKYSILLELAKRFNIDEKEKCIDKIKEKENISTLIIYLDNNGTLKKVYDFLISKKYEEYVISQDGRRGELGKKLTNEIRSIISLKIEDSSAWIDPCLAIHIREGHYKK